MSAAAEKVEDGVDFVRVCRVDELPAFGAAAADIYGQVVAIVRTKEGELYALDDTCTHANVSLSEGEVWCDEKELECPKHGSTFSVLDGQPATLPATQPVPVFDAKVVDGQVVITVDTGDGGEP